MTVSDVYNTAVKPMPMADRLKLAVMILNDIPPQAISDYQDAWTDEDLHDFSLSTWKQTPNGGRVCTA
jgi:hypothetical protein